MTRFGEISLVDSHIMCDLSDKLYHFMTLDWFLPIKAQSVPDKCNHLTLLAGSVTRLGDLLDFGQVFKAFGKN